MSGIADVKVIVQSDILGLAGGAVINPPASLIPSIDEELVKSGHIQPGDLIRYIEQNGINGSTSVKNRLTDDELYTCCSVLYPNNKWACCRRMTQLNCYIVVIAFN